MSDTDRIRKQVVLRAPRSRVWKALSNHESFGAWFRARLTTPFVVGEWSSGNVLYPGYEHLKFEVIVERMEPERHFSFRWHPYAIDAAVDYSTEPTTLVEFELEEVPEGTRLTVTESGFDALPPARRDEAFRMNEGGWRAQTENIRAYVEE